MKYKLVIWDFNGTVLDDAGISIDAINTVMERRNMKPLGGISDFRKVFRFPVEDYYKALGFDFSKEPYKIPADEWVKEYAKRRRDAPVMAGFRDAAERIKAAGIRQMILSATEKNQLIEQIDELGISDLFDEVLGTGDVYAKGKADVAEKWISEQNKEDIFPAVMVGDCDHDYLCSKKIGCDCILHSFGFMDTGRISGFGVPVAKNLSEIADIILEK